MTRKLSEASVVLDLLRAQREGAAGLARRQRERLEDLVAHARAASPYYRELYRALPSGGLALRDLPPVHKPELMAAFDRWVADPGVTRAGVEAFVADLARLGTLFRGEYFVCTTSGTTGHPGLFVHDRGAIAVYRAFSYRIDLAWLSAGEWWGLVRRGLRWASVVGTGGHFASAGWIALERRRSAWRNRAYRVFSVLRPLSELVAELNAFDPAILAAYPSALELLAGEQLAGRLRLHPVILEAGGETLRPGLRAHLAGAFGCAVHEVYGSSEFDPLAFDCREGWLHVSSDWAIVEPVDEALQPTPPGQPSHTVLLTNLANRVQPIIRYDLGDSVLARPAPCPCGHPLPAIRVAGRCDDVLRLQAADGKTVSIVPLAIGTVADETPGVYRCQLVQTGPAEVRVRLEAKPGAEVERVWNRLLAALTTWLAGQGLSAVDLVRAGEPPEVSPRTGKFRQVIARRQAPGPRRLVSE